MADHACTRRLPRPGAPTAPAPNLMPLHLHAGSAPWFNRLSRGDATVYERIGPDFSPRGVAVASAKVLVGLGWVGGLAMAVNWQEYAAAAWGLASTIVAGCYVAYQKVGTDRRRRSLLELHDHLQREQETIGSKIAKDINVDLHIKYRDEIDRLIAEMARRDERCQKEIEQRDKRCQDDIAEILARFRREQAASDKKINALEAKVERLMVEAYTRGADDDAPPAAG